MNEFISVVVPVYNVEDYLIRCIESIIYQTHKNTEIVLVDDGGIDSSGLLSDDLAAKNNNIIAIHKNNGGLSDARNYGMLIAKGQYIVFCDSDDWIEPSILETALARLKNRNADIVVWGYYADFVDENEKVIRTDVHRSVDILVQKNCDNTVECNTDFSGCTGYAWNKLYARRLIEKNRIRYEKGTSLVEDILFNSPVFCAAERIQYISDLGTHYIQRPRETLGIKYYPNYFELKMRAHDARKKIFEYYNIKSTETEFAVLYKAIMFLARTQALDLSDKKKKVAELMLKPKCKEIIEKYRPSGTKNVLVYYLLKLKMYGILIGVYNFQ